LLPKTPKPRDKSKDKLVQRPNLLFLFLRDIFLF